MDRRDVRVTGMSCEGCERNVENALQGLDGVSRVDADHGSDTVEIVAEDDVNDDALHGAIEDAGYEVEA